MDKKFIGIPFEHNGRDFEGIDCIGLVHLYLKHQGIEFKITDGKEITKEWYSKDSERLLNHVRERAYPISYQRKQKADIVLFRFGGIISHIGVMVNDYQFLHITENRTSGLERLSKWKSRLENVYRAGDN